LVCPQVIVLNVVFMLATTVLFKNLEVIGQWGELAFSFLYVVECCIKVAAFSFEIYISVWMLPFLLLH